MKKKRIKFLIDKKFQYDFIYKSILQFVFCFGIIFLIIICWNHYQIKQGFLIRPPENEIVAKWAEENNVQPNSVEYMSQFLVQAKPYTIYDITWKPLLLAFLIQAIFIFITNIM